jgi:predicted nucleic acid-binding protein
VVFLLDTSSYIRILRDRPFAEAAEAALRRIAPRLYLSSVVRAELTQGARGAEGRALVARVARRLEQAGRLVVPLHQDWLRAATVQSQIWDAMPELRQRHLLHDLLVACGARRVGAALVTDNERDYRIIDRWLPTKRLTSTDLTAV